ncbi:ATP-dependent Clp protease ATP-binding subunit, partial [Candidatus Gottesmanbacteria bacterium]|nr:ATP-dependent Clp protease ATP-binding subunit [Candidatus Gottesmanbacteria bacterium]
LMSDYMVWHYLEVWPKIFVLWRNLTVFPIYYFSIPLHLRSFLAPWKRQTVKMKPGFSLSDFFGVIIINLSSRVMGAILRLMTIFYGLMMMPLLFVIGGVIALLWGILIPWTLPFYLIKRKPNEKKKREWIAIRLEKEIAENDVKETEKWYEELHKDGEVLLLLDLNRIKSLPGIGVDWAYGWTAEFDKYAHDLTENHATFPLLIGREKELGELERVLLKTEANNILVVGEPGVARHQLVETLAHRMKMGHTSTELSHKRVLALDMHSLTSNKPSVLEVKGLAAEILEEAEKAGNVIVYIDEIDKYLSSGEGRIDLTDVLSKFAESSVGLIGITTPGAYHKYIESNSTLSKLFESVEISPPSLQIVTNELEISIVPIFEKKYKVTVSYPAIKKTVEDADKYLTSTPFPQKAIELLDQTIVYATSQKKQKFITAGLVDEYLSSKLNMPMGDLNKEENQKLANLENLIHQRIINQEAA